jgi:site-specific recombinase XerD
MSETSGYEIEVAGTTDGGDRVPDLSPREALERWLNKLRVSKAESTVSSYHYRLKHFVEWCEEGDINSIGDVSGWDLETYETHRREQGLTPLTLNMELGTLQNFLEYCARVELVNSDLPEKVDPPDVPRDAQIDETRLHAKDAESLLQYYRESPGEFGTREHVTLTLVWFTGARLGGLRALDLEDYDSDEQHVRFLHRPNEDTPLKNGRDGERWVGLPEHVCDALDYYIEENRHDVFDDYGRQPLLASQVGRPSRNTVRTWMYLATVPCLHSPCPHGNEPKTCDYLDYTHASKCPSSRSPHQVRTGSITWQLNRGIPPQVVSNRVNTSVRIIKEHYDQPSMREELEERRRPHLDQLSFEEGDEQ